ncbi:hypothetical protein [Micromonospora echinaurantiaca]|uniref:hypothetical protein n=1 Tax=Micromonospora echinaurantiaca TaxID=47857 RepID=UPI00378E4FE3
MWDGVEVLDGCELYQFLSREWPSTVGRDTLLLTHSLLSKCREWEDTRGDVETTVSIGSGEPKMALSVGYALSATVLPSAVACLGLAATTQSGFVKVTGKNTSGDVFFFSEPSSLKHFWRRVFSFENVAEAKFFDVAVRAFPGLVLCDGLSFGSFEGRYVDLRERVVEVLSGLCDHFVAAYRQASGIPNDVQAALGAHHLEVSPESPNTRGSERLMRHRDVEHDGRVYRCEWHAKLEPHRNRIHFWVPQADDDEDKLVIGKFVIHLPT